MVGNAGAGIALFAAFVTYQIDPAARSRVTVTGFRTGPLSGKPHHFAFSRYLGSLWFDPQWPDRSRVELIAEAASIECTEQAIKPKSRRKLIDTILGRNVLDVEHFL